MTDEQRPYSAPVDVVSVIGDGTSIASNTQSSDELAQIPPEDRADCVVFAYKARVVLSCVLALAAFYADFYAQTHGMPYQAHDIMVGALLGLWTHISGKNRK